jgi:hypothetical protein
MRNKVIWEDATMAYGKWTAGIASRELTGNKITLSDLFDKFNKQFPNDAKADKFRPHTLDNIVALLGNIIINSDGISDKVKITKNTPFAKKSSEKQELLNSVISKTAKINKLVEGIVLDLDKLVDNQIMDTKIIP